MQDQFVGFATLEALIECLEVSKPVNVAGLVETKGEGPIQRTASLVLVSQGLENECLYCRVLLSRYQTMHGEAFPGEAERQHKIATSGIAAVKDFLERNGFNLREAVIAIPQNLTALDGSADFLRFDKEQDIFVIREEEK